MRCSNNFDAPRGLPIKVSSSSSVQKCTNKDVFGGGPWRVKVQQRYAPDMSRRPSGQAARDDASSVQLNRLCPVCVTMKLWRSTSEPRSTRTMVSVYGFALRAAG
jgi:hypothetical protein